MHVGIVNPRWRGKRSRHSRRMRNPQFYASGKRPMTLSAEAQKLLILPFHSRLTNVVFASYDWNVRPVSSAIIHNHDHVWMIELFKGVLCQIYSKFNCRKFGPEDKRRKYSYILIFHKCWEFPAQMPSGEWHSTFFWKVNTGSCNALVPADCLWIPVNT